MTRLLMLFLIALIAQAQTWKFLVVSDFHLGTLHVLGDEVKVANWTKANGIDLVLWTGDNHDGYATEFYSATQSMRAAGVEQGAIAGNHEAYAAWMALWTNQPQYVDCYPSKAVPHACYQVTSPVPGRQWGLLLLSSNQNTGEWADGLRAWAQNILASHPATRFIIITHCFQAIAGVIPVEYRNQPCQSDHDSGGQCYAQTWGYGIDLWNDAIAPYPNVAMVFSGHMTGPPGLIGKTATNGNTVWLGRPEGHVTGYYGGSGGSSFAPISGVVFEIDESTGVVTSRYWDLNADTMMDSTDTAYWGTAGTATFQLSPPPVPFTSIRGAQISGPVSIR